jgi:hypothetical protein
MWTFVGNNFVVQEILDLQATIQFFKIVRGEQRKSKVFGSRLFSLEQESISYLS